MAIGCPLYFFAKDKKDARTTPNAVASRTFVFNPTHLERYSKQLNLGKSGFRICNRDKEVVLFWIMVGKHYQQASFNF